MSKLEMWVRLDLRNRRHRAALELLTAEEECGATAELLQGSPPTPQPQHGDPSVARHDSSPPAPIELSRLDLVRHRLRNKVLTTKVGQNFLLPVVAAMVPGQWYTLEQMSQLKPDYSKAQAHSSLSVAGRIERRFGEIFERQPSEGGGPLKLRVTAEMKSLLTQTL